jgi:ABC-type phosphate transport system permease subunit
LALLKCIIIFGAIILFYDTGAAFLSRTQDIAYEKFTLGSLLIQIASGYVVKQTKWLWASLLVGATTAGIEATIGWLISWQIGPGKLPEMNGATDQAIYGTIIVTIILVILIGLSLGLIGGVIKKVQNILTQKHA